MTRRTKLVLGLALLFLLALVGAALARPGGGQSYSGGGGHSSSSGGGGSSSSSGSGDIGALFELIYHLVRLIVYYPEIGIPLVILIVVWIMYSAYQQHKNKDWDSGPAVQLQRAIPLDDLRRVDPNFSQVLFEDFAYRLFSTAHRARHAADALATIAPYVAEPARQALAKRKPPGERVESVVIGAMRSFRLDIPPAARDREGRPYRERIGIEFEANVTTAKKTYYSVESWLFGREAGRQGKPPGASKSFPCPNCGAPWQASSTGTQVCASCNQAVDNGRFDWSVEQISLLSMDERPPTLIADVPERGTDLPTYYQAGAEMAFVSLQQHDPNASVQAIQQRLHMIYDELNRAWSKNDLTPIRGLVSDGLYDYLSYWVEAYKRQGLRNKLEQMRITGTTFAKVQRDRWYDAVTIRIWATGYDFTVRSSDGKHVKGSRMMLRPYSEYWTLIRSATRRGPAQARPVCGNCGAPLQITQSGECTHCNVHLTAGEFDWVLSKIEQDDSYRG
ncbi:MAG: TIM44-like domain-containing protein, partial [Deltaproteobacteria bacterium]|nr:TIM44-like domain-containing protein [Deltaproteobacteria bacterium]